MKHVLVLGAGMVAQPLVRYLQEHNYKVIIASRTVSKAEALLNEKFPGEAIAWTVDKVDELDKMIAKADLTVSLLPYAHHITVVDIALKYRKPVVTTSYVSEKMLERDAKAKEAGVIILNEIGLDPGIDHMSAMKMMDAIKNRGGRIVSFKSYCGALPAKEAADNPFKYKFAWSPFGVVQAAKNNGHFYWEGKEVSVEGKDLFKETHQIEVPDIGTLECYPNRDSIPYIDVYNLDKEIETMFRGTLRYVGWCEVWDAFHMLNLLDQTKNGLNGLTHAEFMAKLVNGSVSTIKDDVAKFLKVGLDSEVMKNSEWLGLFDDAKIELENESSFDVLCSLLHKKLVYKDGERDAAIMHHEITGEFEDGSREVYIADLVDYGEIGIETSVARTVALPAAISVRMILEGEINIKGVHIPVLPEIYEPVLRELEEVGIKFAEHIEKI